MSPEGESILIVDDEQPVRHMLSRFLKGQEYTVTQLESGAEALGKDRGKGVDVRRPPGEPAHQASRVFRGNRWCHGAHGHRDDPRAGDAPGAAPTAGHGSQVCSRAQSCFPPEPGVCSLLRSSRVLTGPMSCVMGFVTTDHQAIARKDKCRAILS